MITPSIDHTFDLDDAAIYGAAFLTQFGGDVNLAREAVIDGLIEGFTYFNIHTALHQTGEIRGDIVRVVPAPAALLVVALGAGMALARRRLG